MQFVDESGRFASLADCPFGRRGSYYAICLTPGASESFGRTSLYIATCHGAAAAAGQQKLYDIYPIYEGERVPFAIIMQPTELILRTLYGDIKICIAEPTLMMFSGENKLGLRLQTAGDGFGRITKPRGQNAWETFFTYVCSTVFNPLSGHIEADVPWEWDSLKCGVSRLDLLPDVSGCFEGCLEEFSHAGYLRESYPTYTEGLRTSTDDWEDFLSKIKPLPGRYEAMREHAAYNLWSYLVGPSGLIKRELLYMGRFGPASAWQMCFQAAALDENVKAGWDLMLTPFDHQNAVGQTTDFYDDCRGIFTSVRPPIQGWALALMKQLGLYEKLTAEMLSDFYPKLSAWANWFINYRIAGVDRLPHYEQTDESGMEDGTTFRYSPVMVTPDLPAYLVLLFEELADMSRRLVHPESEALAWLKKASDIQARLIDRLWDGEKFVSHTLDGKTIDKDYGILGYLPVLLGKRLPQNILSKLVNDLKTEGVILSDYGFVKEKLTARELCAVTNNFVSGYIYQPFNLLLISGLYFSGEKTFAAMVARHFCDGMLDGAGIGSTLNAFTGAIAAQWKSWCAGTYLLIARFTE